MSDIHDHDADNDAIYERIRGTIEENDQCLVGVEGEPSFVYTIGNHERGLPELLMIGKTRVYGIVLNILGRIQRDRGYGFADGELVDLGGPAPVKMIIANWRGREEYAVQAIRYYRDWSLQVAQVLIPDSAGRFPGEFECGEPQASQIVLQSP